METLALVTAIAATGHDDDLVALLDACADAGLHARAVAWDDPTVSWARFDAVLLRSPWDYTERLPEFLAWAEQVDHVTTLLNPMNVVRWNTDKHYLADLAAVGIPSVPTTFVEPDAEPMDALTRFLEAFPTSGEFVVKPAVSAGARTTVAPSPARIAWCSNRGTSSPAASTPTRCRWIARTGGHRRPAPNPRRKPCCACGAAVARARSGVRRAVPWPAA